MANFTEILDWDSNFFSLKIASVVIDSADPEFLDNIISEYKTLNFDLIYLFIKGEVIIPNVLLSRHNSILVDIKQIYEIDLVENIRLDSKSTQIKEFRGKPSELYNLAFQSGVRSRYKLDRNFSNTDFQNLYKIWVKNSLNHTIADKVIVYEEDSRILGFITLQIEENNSVAIGLIATDYTYRSKGIGSVLINYAKYFTIEQGLHILNVATQKENLAACSFYKKQGMSLKSETYIYHIWLKKQIQNDNTI